MTTTVTSKFRTSLWVRLFFFGLLTFILITVVVTLADQDYSPSSAHEMMAILIILIWLISVHIYRATKRFTKVTVSPDKLTLHYLLIAKRTVVNYADIVHAEVDQKNSYYFGMIDHFAATYSIVLKIVLNTGENLSLYDEYYSNFDQMKEAIRRARFGLD